MSQPDDLKRKETEAEKAPAAEPKEEPEVKKAKTSAAPAAVRKQVEYYLSDDNLKHDKFFHEKISSDAEGWLDISFILSSNKMKVMGATKDAVVAALAESQVEVKEGGSAVRRPANAALPKLEERPGHHKKSSIHAHDGGVVCVFKNVPEEQKWTVVKEKVKESLPPKTSLWHVSEVSDKNECFLACAPFEGDQKFFESLEIEVGNAKLKCELCNGELLQKALKLLPKHIRDKRDKEMKKRQKERNRPILMGTQRYDSVSALRGRVKEILNSRSDGEQLKVDGSDFKLIKALIGFHPNPEKSKGMIGLKVGKASVGDSRCFYMIKEGGVEEDVSSKKCLEAVEMNPPYVEKDAKGEKKTGSTAASPAKEGQAAKPIEAAAAADSTAAPAAESVAAAAAESSTPSAAEPASEAAPAAKEADKADLASAPEQA